jgi:hypothetical protein
MSQAPHPAPSSSSPRAAAPSAAEDDLELVWHRRLGERDGRDYDRFVERTPAGHFAQARWWAPLARAGRPLGSSFLLVRDRSWGVVAAAHVLRARILGLPLPYAVIERGPVVADPTLFAPVLRRLMRAARRRGIARLAVMPYWEVGAGAEIRAALEAEGWRSAQTVAGAHAATLRLELATPGGAASGAVPAERPPLFAGGDFKKLRQEIRHAEQAGARARRGGVEDLPRFVTLYRDLMAAQRLHAKPDAWFRALAALDLAPAGTVGLFFTEHQGDTVAGALTIRHGRRVTLYLAASAQTPGKFSRMVPALVAAVGWARDLGCDFDLGGVPMTGDTDQKRLSIARFKRDFSKDRVELIGAYARWLIR